MDKWLRRLANLTGTTERAQRRSFVRVRRSGGSYTVMNLQGALQHAGGLEGTAVGRPEMRAFSPARFFELPQPKYGNKSHVSSRRAQALLNLTARFYRDCLHPNDEGFGVLLDALADRHLVRALKSHPHRKDHGVHAVGT